MPIASLRITSLNTTEVNFMSMLTQWSSNLQEVEETLTHIAIDYLEYLKTRFPLADALNARKRFQMEVASNFEIERRSLFNDIEFENRIAQMRHQRE